MTETRILTVSKEDKGVQLTLKTQLYHLEISIDDNSHRVWGKVTVPYAFVPELVKTIEEIMAKKESL